jgi:hypothetical protein
MPVMPATSVRDIGIQNVSDYAPLNEDGVAADVLVDLAE